MTIAINNISNEFFLVPSTDDLYVNKKSEFILGKTNESVLFHYDKQKQHLILGYWYNGSRYQKRVSRILAQMFIPVPEEFKELDPCMVRVGHKDGNSLNIEIENLFWTTNKERLQTFWKRRFEKNFLENLSPVFNEYNVVNTESIEYTGFYYIPFSNNPLLINNKGIIIDLLKEKEKKPYVNKKGYLKISFRDRNSNKTKVMSVHRIIGLMFIKKPNKYKTKLFSELEINHKDGNKQNNVLANLEWCTSNDNLKHAFETGLINNSTKIVGKNILTDEIINFKSITECANIFNLSHSSLCNHLNSKEVSLIAVDNYVFKRDDNTKWPNKILIKDGRNLLGKSLDFVVEDIRNKKYYIFSDLKQACYLLNLKLGSVIWHRRTKGINIPYKDFIFYPLENVKRNELIKKYDTI